MNIDIVSFLKIREEHIVTMLKTVIVIEAPCQ
jgi:hypothetical protein